MMVEAFSFEDYRVSSLLETIDRENDMRIMDIDNKVGPASGDSSSAVMQRDAQVLRDTALVYGSAFLVIFALFCWARRRFPRVYNVRRFLEGRVLDESRQTTAEIGTNSDREPSLFAWLREVYKVTDDEIMEKCGMDALCFIRITKLGAKLSFMGLLNSLWLSVMYATSPVESDTQDIHDPIVKITIANVPAGSRTRLIAAVIASYIFFLYAMRLILLDFTWYTRMRHKFLRQRLPRNYSVFIRNIPENYRNNRALEEFMSSCFSSETVLEAHVAVTTGQLAKLQADRSKVLDKLEHALAQFEATGRRPRHRRGRILLGNLVDSIETHERKLEELNDRVDQSITAVERRISSVMSPEPAGDDVNNSFSPDSAPEDPETAPLIARESRDVEHGRRKGVAAIGKTLSTVGNLATGVVGNTLETATGAVGGAIGQVENLASEAVALIAGVDDGIPHPAGFVVFSRLATANAALQTIHHPTPFAMNVSEAPDPTDIFWINMSRTHESLELGGLMSIALTTGLCLLWTIPMSFIASLSSVDGLRKTWDVVDEILDTLPFLVPLFQITAPFLVVVANSLLPTILKAITLLEGPISGASVEASLFTKLATFMVLQTFFVSEISGGLIGTLEEMIESPKLIVDLLARSLPKQATYFMQIAFVSIVVSGGMELLRVTPVILAVARSFIGPRLTEKERRKTFYGLRPLCDPAEFLYAHFTSQAVFYFMVLLVYSVISPLTNLVVAFCFLFLGLLARHHFNNIYPKKADSGGKLWSSFIKIIVRCMIIAQVTMLGLLGLKKAKYASPCFLPLLISTLMFSFYINQQHFRVAEFLPTRSCLEEDMSHSVLDADFLRGSYLQPELTADRRLRACNNQISAI